MKSKNNNYKYLPDIIKDSDLFTTTEKQQLNNFLSKKYKIYYILLIIFIAAICVPSFICFYLIGIENWIQKELSLTQKYPK